MPTRKPEILKPLPTMNVIMRGEIQGTRNGLGWPKPGESIELPVDEALQLCMQGMAYPNDTYGWRLLEEAETPRKHERYSVYT